MGLPEVAQKKTAGHTPYGGAGFAVEPLKQLEHAAMIVGNGTKLILVRVQVSGILGWLVGGNLAPFKGRSQ